MTIELILIGALVTLVGFIVGYILRGREVSSYGVDNFFTWLERSGVDLDRVYKEMETAWHNQDTYYHKNRGK